MLSLLLALFSAFSFATASIFIQRGLQGKDLLGGVWINILTSSLVLWIAFLLSGADLLLSRLSLGILIGIGLLVPAVSRLCVFIGIDRLGSSVSSTVVNATPLFSILFAVLLLRERPSPLTLLGAGSIVAGLSLLTAGRSGKQWRTADLVFPFSAALLFAIRDVLVKIALREISSPLLGAAITSTTSSLLWTLLLLVRRRDFQTLPLRGPHALPFLTSGLFTSLSYLSMYVALQADAVSFVAPLVNSSSLFVLLLAPLALKRLEQITPRKVAGTMVTVAGVCLIAVEKL